MVEAVDLKSIQYGFESIGGTFFTVFSFSFKSTFFISLTTYVTVYSIKLLLLIYIVLDKKKIYMYIKKLIIYDYLGLVFCYIVV